MEREAKGKTYKMKGHTLPGINQRSDAKAKNVAEQGLAGSSAFQDRVANMTGMDKEQQAAATAHNNAHAAGKDPHESSALKQDPMMGMMGAGNIAQTVQQRNPRPPGGVGGMTGLGGGGTMLPGTSTFARKSSVAKDRITNLTGLSKEQIKQANAHNEAHAAGESPHKKRSVAKRYKKTGSTMGSYPSMKKIK